jgi:hypothetical protein
MVTLISPLIPQEKTTRLGELVVWDYYGFRSPAARSYEEGIIMMTGIIRRMLMAGMVMMRCMRMK